MTADHRLYATLVHLYPRRFRHEFADDMVVAFDDFIEHRGRAATWRRVIVDLIVTVPIYRLETVMAPQRSPNALVAICATLVVGAVVTFAMGLWPVAAVLLLTAVVIGITQHSQLARSLRPGSGSHRRRLLARSAVLALLAVAVLVVGMVDLGDESHWPAGRLLLYNALFFAAVVAALAHLVVAFRHPDGTPDLAAAT
jgi:hypothetical protein